MPDEEIIVNVQELEDEDPSIKMPEEEEDCLDDALEVIRTRMCTVLMNLLSIEHPLHTVVRAMYPYPSNDYIYDGMGVPIPRDDYDEPIEPKYVDGRYPDDATQTPYIVLNGGVPKERSLSLWYMNNEGIITPENMVHPHFFIHLGRNSRVHKTYCEFNYDRLMLNYLRSTGVYTYFRTKSCKKIYDEYPDEMKHHERIFMIRPRLYCPKEYSVSDILTVGTVGHWQSFQGSKEFLNDKIETELAFTQYKLKKEEGDDEPFILESEYFNRLERFAAQIHEFNRQLTTGKWDHDKTFREYRSFYNHEFRDPYETEDPDTGEIEHSFYLPLYDFYEKFYAIYFTDLIPDVD